jgi:hypothetical protein
LVHDVFVPTPKMEDSPGREKHEGRANISGDCSKFTPALESPSVIGYILPLHSQTPCWQSLSDPVGRIYTTEIREGSRMLYLLKKNQFLNIYQHKFDKNLQSNILGISYYIYLTFLNNKLKIHSLQLHVSMYTTVENRNNSMPLTSSVRHLSSVAHFFQNIICFYLKLFWHISTLSS